MLAAVPTAAAGAADWSDSYGPDQRVGAVHAIANVIGLGLYGWSLRARRRGDRATATALGLAGMTSMAVGGYLGGYLSHSRGVGVNNAFYQHGPEDWTAVLDEAQLEERVPARAVAGDATVLLYRTGAQIHAIASRCSHAGGPLDEGDVDAANCTVTCPWHQSVFACRTAAWSTDPPASPKPPTTRGSTPAASRSACAADTGAPCHRRAVRRPVAVRHGHPQWVADSSSE